MVKTLLILGAGCDQLPGIMKAKEMGVYTIALDGNPDAIGKTHADEFYPVSIKHFQQIDKFCTTQLKKKVDGVIAFGVDIPTIIAQTSELLGVNYTIPIRSAELSEDKYLAKEFMSRLRINIPIYHQVKTSDDINAFIQANGLPIVVKPVDNSASRGVSLVSHDSEVNQAFDEAVRHSSSKKLIVEKFLDGPQISTESFIINGSIHNIGFADRNYNDMDKFFPHIIENGGDLPSLYLKEQHKKQLTQFFERIAKALKIENGVIKGDIVIHHGQLYIIEFALRLSGGNFSTIEIPQCTGIDFIKIAIQLHLNIKIQASDLIQNKNNCISIRYKFPEDARNGLIKKTLYPVQNTNIILQQFHVSSGDTINNKTTDHAKRLGFVIANGSSRQEAISNANRQIDKMEIIVE